MSQEDSTTAATSLNVADKLTIAKEKKDVADQAFKAGDIKGGARLVRRVYGIADFPHATLCSIAVLSYGDFFGKRGIIEFASDAWHVKSLMYLRGLYK